MRTRNKYNNKFFHLFSLPKEQTLFAKTKRALTKLNFEVGGAKKSSPMIYFLKITQRFANKSQTHHFVSHPIKNIGMDKVLQTGLLLLLHLLIFYELNQMDNFVS